MKRETRITGMVVALVFLLASAGSSLLIGNPPDALSMIFGVAAGWALRETLVPKSFHVEKIGSEEE